MSYTLTAIILCHNEGSLVNETIFSVLRAWEYYRIHNFSDNAQLQICFVLDSHTIETHRAVFSITNKYSNRYSFKTIEVCHGDPGLSRNSGLEEAESDYVMVIDGDDLISSDFIDGYFSCLHKSFIAHPEYLVTFGAKCLIWRQPAFERIEESKQLVITANPYDTCSIGPKRLYLDVRYSEARQSQGFGYEDWHFTLESNFHGVAHDIIKDTIKYTRIKTQSRLRSDKAQSSLMPYSLFIESMIST